MTQVKICGLTRVEDVDLACGLGAAYVGFNFSALSPRRVTVETARTLARATRPGVARVGVFVRESPAEIREAIGRSPLDFVQIHRPLCAEDLDRLPRPVIAVARVSSNGVAAPPPELLARCRSLLCDTESEDRSGGTGVPFDWNVLAGRRWPIPLILAGGLRAENVGEAIARVRPFGVDVASGVEAAPGIKDEEKMKRFFDAVRKADSVSPSVPGRGAG